MDDDKGTSLIFVNTSKGREVFGHIENKMEYKEVNLDQAIALNPAAIRAARSNRNRSGFFDELDKIPFDQLVKKYCTEKYLVRVKRKIKTVIRNILEKVGLLETAKRVLRKG
jgi:histone H3/H4